MAIEKRLQKVFLSFHNLNNDLLQYEQTSLDGNGLKQVKIPFDTNAVNLSDIEMRFFDKDARYCTSQDIGLLNYLLNADENAASKKYEDEISDSVVMQGLAVGEAGRVENYFHVTEDAKFPQLKYSDVTEKDMFGYPAILSSDLTSEEKGLWSYHGLRKLELDISNLEENLNLADAQIKVSMFWFEIGNVKINNIFEEKIRYVKNTESDGDSYKFIAYINTNVLGEAIKNYNIQSKHPVFSGRFELHISYSTEKYVYSFPVKLVIADTSLDAKGKNPCVSNQPVSIDFGTSSTCAAIKCRDGIKLFRLSGNDKYEDNNNNPYENPTNVMLYNWNEIFSQWDKVNHNCPFFLTKTPELSEKMADYDSGYTVEEEYKNADEEDGLRKTKAIITQIKMLPYYLAHGMERTVTPYGSDSPLNIVANVDEEDGTKFNPVAFYGYLISRAINNPANGEIYKLYQVTFPAKFNKDIVEQIRSSLEYGIKRALPKTIRDGVYRDKPIVSVKMEYSEPQACVGAVLGTQLKLEDEKAKLFAVYDLGGGTMDFAFGALREPTEDEEDDGYDAMVTFTGVDGVETVGGERLIHQLAYKIYRDSMDSVVENKIKFILPEGEKNPYGFDGLVSDRREETSEANLNILKEIVARPLFEYNGDLSLGENVEEALQIEGNDTISKEDDSTFVISLQDANKEFVDVKLKIDRTAINDFIREKIQATIEQFKDLIYKYFTKPEAVEHLADYYDLSSFDIKDVNIFLGGNASKQYYVEELMRDEMGFGSEQRIERIGEGQNDDSMSDEYRINEKTSVAVGQINLGSTFGVDDVLIRRDGDVPSFQFTVGYKDRDGNFQVVIEKNEISTEWKEANSIDKRNFTTDLYYCATSTTDLKEMKPLTHSVEDFWEDKHNKVYLRVNCENKVEFRLCRGKNAPDNSEEVDEEMLITLLE